MFPEIHGLSEELLRHEWKNHLVRRLKLAVGDMKLDNKGKRNNPLSYLDSPIHYL